MEHGQVRTILWRLAANETADPMALDPNGFVPASRLRRSLEGLTPAQQRAAGADYARLWARTFRTLVSHLRGRPERALSLFAEEVYPFLRGDRRAARIERSGPRRARIVLADDLPAEYLCGLAAGFVGLSGANASAEPAGPGVLQVSFATPASHRLARLVAHGTTLRLPLIACALLAVLTGAALASVAGPIDATRLALTLAGVGAAQLGANALHALRTGLEHPFAPGRAARPLLLAQTVGAYTAAAAAGVWLVILRGPFLLAFAGMGLLLGVAYARFRAEGLGPVIAGAAYGLIIPAGTVAVLQPGVLASPVAVPLAGAPLGLMAAAMLLLDNLADRPLDEAGGQRTLAVRLPAPRAASVYAGLLALAILWTGALTLAASVPAVTVGAMLLAVPAAWLARRARADLADPHRLAPVRLGTFALLVAVALLPLALSPAVAA